MNPFTPHQAFPSVSPVTGSTVLRVLVVDDEPEILDITQRFLERSGSMKVTCCSSVVDALEVIRNNPFDAVVSDYEMPVATGIDLLFSLRSSGNVLPVIIFTGRGREDVVIEALNTGASFYLRKEGNPTVLYAELTHLIRRAVDQRRYKSGLKESERFITNIFHHLPDATFVINHDGIVIAWNRAMEEMTGIAAGEIIGRAEYAHGMAFYGQPVRTLADHLLDDTSALPPSYTLLERAPGMMIAEICTATLNGYPVILWKKATHLYDPLGKICGAIETIRDVTLIKHAETELIRVNRYHRTLIESHIDPLVTMNPDLTICDVNAATEDLLGYGREELIGSGFCSWFRRPDLVQEICAQLESVGRIVEYPAMVKRKNGNIKTVYLYATVCRGIDGEIWKIFMEIHDPLPEPDPFFESCPMLSDLVDRITGPGDTTRSPAAFLSHTFHLLAAYLTARAGFLLHIIDDQVRVYETSGYTAWLCTDPDLLPSCREWITGGGTGVWVIRPGVICFPVEQGERGYRAFLFEIPCPGQVPAGKIDVITATASLLRYCSSLLGDGKIQTDDREMIDLRLRLLTHDLGNVLSVLWGLQDMLSEYVSGTGRGRKRDRSGESVYVHRYHRKMEMVISGTVGSFLEPTDLMAVIQEEASRFSRVEISSDCSENLWVWCDPLISEVVWNLLDTSTRHGGSDVTIRI
jgi:PAS domain S-box-containing protein